MPCCPSYRRRSGPEAAYNARSLAPRPVDMRFSGHRISAGSGLSLGTKKRESIHGDQSSNRRNSEGRLPPGTQILQYDCKNSSVDIIDGSDVEQNSPYLLELSPKMKEVALFLDAGTQRCVSTNPDHNKESNVLLAKIQLAKKGGRRRGSQGVHYVYVENMDWLFADNS